MDVKSLKELKRRYQLASEPVVQNQTSQKPGPGAAVRAPAFTAARVSRPTNPSLIWFEFLPEPEATRESVKHDRAEESIGGSGWGYSQLLKEFRE